MSKYTLLFIISFFFCSFGIAQVPGACGSSKKNPSAMNGNATLGMTYNQSACGLNYVEAHQLVETRYNAYALPQNMGTGLPTTLAIAGLPNSGTILKAYLWYNVSYQETTPPATTVNFTNTIPTTANIPATNIGSDQGKCWSETGTVNYRADVTAAISGNGNYAVNITGLSNPNWEVDGVELIIIYKDNMAAYQGSFVIWDGAIVQQGPASTQIMTGINACSAGVNAKAFVVISDMQDNTNSNAHPSTLNGVTTNFPNNMWNYDEDNTTVTSGQATANFGTDGLGMDCYDWSIMGLYYQTTNCTVCAPCLSTTVTVDSVINVSACVLNNGAVYINDSTTAGPLTYNWSNGATTQDISGLSSGIYSVIIKDQSGCSLSYTFAIHSPINLVTSVDSTTNIPCHGTNGAIYVSVSGGTMPYTYNWSNGATTQDITGLTYGNFTLTVTDSSGCMTTNFCSDEAPYNFPTPSICIVTVDSLSQNNVIMWDKTSFAAGDSFIVYREVTTNNYQPLGAVSFDSLSMFIDTVRTKYFPNTGNPNAGTYRYKLGIRDSCGNYSILSPYHNTIFMTNNNGNFSWPQLYTIENSTNPVGSYVLMRDDSSNGNWHAVNSVAGTQQTVSDPSYSNWQSTANWRVQTLWSISCSPTRLNMNILTNFNASKSNTLNALSSSITETYSLNNLISVYPNPTKGEFMIYSSQPVAGAQIKIMNIFGETILQKTIKQNQEIFNLKESPAGIYFLNIKTQNGIVVKKIIKE